MGIRLHPDVFRALAAWLPGDRTGNSGAERLMETGGITVATLQLLQDYACSLVGLEPGSSALIYIKGPPSGYLWFGERVEAGDGVQGATYTEVRLANLDPFFIYRAPASTEHKFGLHRLEHNDGTGGYTPIKVQEESEKIGKLFSDALSNVPLVFLQEKTQ